MLRSNVGQVSRQELTKGGHHSPKSAPRPSTIQWEQEAARHDVICVGRVFQLGSDFLRK